MAVDPDRLHRPVWLEVRRCDPEGWEVTGGQRAVCRLEATEA